MTLHAQLLPNEIEIGWHNGLVAVHQLRDDQVPIYFHLMVHRKPFIECSRRFGKTTSILCYVAEQLMQNDGWVCRWVLPEKDQARTIVIPEIERIFESCPEELRPKYQRVDSVFKFPNGSQLFLYGADKDKGKRLRGPFAHIIVCDEYGFWTDPTIVERILMPQLLTTRGQLIIASTPSEDLAHPYYIKQAEALRDGILIQKTIYDNASLSDEDIEQACRDSGGQESPVWLREYLLKPVADPEKLVVPEWVASNSDFEGLNIVPDDYPRPAYFDAYVGGDAGFDDNTALLFGYYDFLKNEVVIEDEYVTRGELTRKTVEVAKEIEARLWGKDAWLRVFDAGKQLLYDIQNDHGYPVVLPDKADLKANVHQLRARIKQVKFKVKHRCVNLRRQLLVGMWKDDQHRDFKRSKQLGHLDALAAAIYFNRAIVESRNPYPPNLGMRKATHHVPQSPVPSGDGGDDVEAVF